MKQIYRLLLLLWCCVSALHAETKVDAIHLLTKDDGMAGKPYLVSSWTNMDALLLQRMMV